MILDLANRKLANGVVAQTFLNVACGVVEIFTKLRTVAYRNVVVSWFEMTQKSRPDVETSTTCAVNEHPKKTRGISQSRNQKVDWRFRNKRLAFLGC
jgi:Tfp pilus assembly major pilin PilA